MKKYVLFVLTLLIVCCNDNFLEKTPKDKLTDNSFWMVEEDAVKYSTSAYRYLFQPGNHIIMLDCYTDNAVPVHVHADQGLISSGSATASCRHFLQVWQEAYAGIRRCNVFLENIPKVEMNEEKKKILIGEMEFLRAYYHVTLLKFYGGVPILTKSLRLNEPIPVRNTADEVYRFIMDECDKAAEKLPLKRVNAMEIGRANKGAPLALKAHVSYLMNQYEDALNSAKAVMDLGVYELFDHYGGLFLPENENNREVIFDHQYMEKAYDTFFTGSRIDRFFAPLMMGGWEALSPSQDLVDAYPCIDGKSIQESPLYHPEKPFENRDPRLDFSILQHGSEFGGKIYSTEGTLGNGSATRTGYSMRKYINPKNVGNEYPGWTNFILFRYAEILLIYAEAENEVNGPNKAVYEHLNKVRQRPSVELPPFTEGHSKEQLREVIRGERRLEFTFEGIHLFETRAWKTTEACVKKPVYGMTHDGNRILIESRSFNPGKDYLWAIPLTEIDLSKGTLQQNPGY